MLGESIQLISSSKLKFYSLAWAHLSICALFCFITCHAEICRLAKAMSNVEMNTHPELRDSMRNWQDSEYLEINHLFMEICFFPVLVFVQFLL